MGINGKPGASLRAFRDFIPNAYCYGGDIDKNILFSEDRILTAYVDQLKPDTFEEMAKEFNLNKKFNLIIDDGLHSTECNLNTLIWSLGVVERGGFIVIEDIPQGSIVVWKIVYNLLHGDEYSAYIVKCKNAVCFVVHRL
jgi:hypothetical protein